MVLMMMMVIMGQGSECPSGSDPLLLALFVRERCVMCACGQAGGRILWAWGGGAVSVHCKALKVIYV